MQIVKQTFLRIGFTVVLIAVLGFGGWTWATLS